MIYIIHSNVNKDPCNIILSMLSDPIAEVILTLIILTILYIDNVF
jgi:hypothetical protein